MKANRVLCCLLLRLVRTFRTIQCVSFFVVEAFGVSRRSPQLPSSRIVALLRTDMIIHPARRTFPENCHNFVARPPNFSKLKILINKDEERNGCPSRLASKNLGDDEGRDSDSHGVDGDSGNENTSAHLMVTTEEETVVVSNQRERSFLSDFFYGANYVHSQYLSIFWRYSILRSFAVTMPIGFVLWMNQDYGLYEMLFRILHSILSVSSIVARFLQLPLEFAQSLILNVWNTSPEAFAAAINFLPNTLAIPVVQLLLFIRAGVTSLVEVCCDNNIITLLSSMIAILVWRPAVEEWQYRSVLDKLLFLLPRWMLARGQDMRPMTTAMMQRIKTLEMNVTNKVGISKNQTSSLSELLTPLHQTVSDPTTSNQSIPVNETNGNSTYSDFPLENEDGDGYTPFLPDESTRILLGSLLFATTRLAWLSSDPADTVSLSNSPYGFTIGFLQSIGSLMSSSGGVTEVRHGLRIFILLMAIHQTVSTFLVAQHVFAGIYRQRGLAASVGAHVSWTIGKGTIIFRLLWKVWKSTYVGLWSASYGSSPEGETDDDDNGANQPFNVNGESN